MRKIVNAEKCFESFPCALYATDVTFQQCNRPGGTMGEGKVFFSGKHHLYGLKVEVSVLPTGLAINCTDHARGSVADIEIFRSNMDFHRNKLAKGQDLDLTDIGPMKNEFGGSWAVLTDKGYQGLEQVIRAIHPVKARPNQPISRSDNHVNRLIASDRIIAENYFGRLTTLWKFALENFAGMKKFTIQYSNCVLL